MSDLFAVAGARFYIGSAAMTVPTTDVTEATFSAVSWIEVDGWETMGAIGDAANEIVTQLINRGRDTVQKGTRRSPTQQHNFAVNTSDAGQQAMIAAEAAQYNYPFKLVFDDAPSAGTPSEKKFIGLVLSAQEQGGGANTTRMLQCSVAPNTNIVSKAASA